MQKQTYHKTPTVSANLPSEPQRRTLISAMPRVQITGEKAKGLKLLQVVPALVMGGVERGTLDIAQAVVREGGDSFVASQGGAMVPELERYGSHHLALPLKTKLPWSIYGNSFRLGKAMDDHNIGVVHARSRAPAWSAMLAARRRNLPFVTTFHGTYRRNSLFKSKYNSVMVRGDRVIAISQFISDHIQRFYNLDSSRIRVIPRGIDETIFDPTKVSQERMIALATAWRLLDGLPVILLPARLSRWKGHEVLIEALCQMQRHDVLAVFAGSEGSSPHYRQELEKLIHDRGLGGRVRIGIESRDMAAVYALSDVVVSASTQPEAFGRVAAEASAMGRLVVATNHGASPEIIIPERGGWLVPPQNPTELAKVLDHALGLSIEERRNRGAVARAHIVAHFTKKLMCDATLNLYNEVRELKMQRSSAHG
ncbi:MAG: glycosyltransferase family 4 protein [Candidatus Pacebacteria bacterium]|nr:glycosyltransferase family 4 protein [Candidatus Paceibacterota bacterium]